MGNGNVSLFDKVVMILIIMTPVLNMYASPLSMSLASFLCFVFSIFFSIRFLTKSRRGGQRILCYGLGFYFIYRGVSYLLWGVLPLAVFQDFLCFFMAFGCFHKDYYIRYLKIVAIVAIVFFFYQHMQYLATGMRTSGVVSFLTLHDGVSNDEFRDLQIYFNRSSSFFSEPSHFAQFLIPLLAIELYYDKTRFHLIFALVIFVVLLLLQSGTGFIGLVPIAIFYVPFFFKNVRMKPFMKVGFILLICFVVGIITYYYLNSEIGESVLNRSDELEASRGYGSGFIRMWRGYFVFFDYSLIEKIFGISDPDLVLSHIKNSGMYLGIKAELYFNALQDILLFTGFIGLVIFSIIIWKIWKGNTVCGRVLICTLIAFSLVEHIYFGNVMLVHLLLAQSMKKEQKAVLYNHK